MAYAPDSAVPNSAYELGNMGLDGTATNLGWNAGLKWKALPNLSFGFAYRSEIELKISGSANFLPTRPAGFDIIAMPTAATSPYSRTRAAATVSTPITLPATFGMAVACQRTQTPST